MQKSSQMKSREKYLTDENGNRIGVLLEIEEYHKLLEALEELEAIRAYDSAVSGNDEEITFENAISQINMGLLSYL